MSEHFVQRSQFDAENQNKQIHSSITTHIGEYIPFVSYMKRILRFFFITFFFQNYFLYAYV